jgi:hypothetical protein
MENQAPVLPHLGEDAPEVSKALPIDSSPQLDHHSFHLS